MNNPCGEAPEAVIALDIGLKKTGLAHLTGGVPFPAGVVRGGRDTQWRAFLKWSAGQAPAIVVLGLPRTHEGGLTEIHGRIMWWKKRLETLGAEVVLEGENFSSREARAMMADSGGKASEDELAAVVLLQRYLNRT